MASKSGSHSYGSRRVLPPRPVNFVHSDSIHRETIRKELELAQLRTEFFINPYQPGNYRYVQLNRRQKSKTILNSSFAILVDILYVAQ